MKAEYEEVFRQLRQGELTAQQAIDQLVQFGVSRAQAAEFVHISQGGSDMIFEENQE